MAVTLASPTLAETLGGKRSRAALPDDFTELVKPLQRRTVERHNKATDEGALPTGAAGNQGDR
jgi:hypothetical protein